MKKLLLASALTVSMFVAATPSAFAGGFLGDLIGGDVGRALDEGNAEAGRPFDHFIYDAAGVVVGVVTENPAAGTATTEVLESYDSYRHDDQ